MKFSIGNDPEFMLFDNKGNLYSAIGIVPGTKEKQHRIGDNAYYYDNVLAECTIKPAHSKKEAVSNIRTALLHFAALVAPYKLVCQASADYPKDQLQHEDALKIACVPEFCAYDLREVERPENQLATLPLRSCGGHIHIGTEFCKDTLNCFNTIRMLDLFLGIPSLFLNKDETSVNRRVLYGQAGRFRSPKHGAEYRTLDNFWLASPKYVELVYDIVDFTMNFMENGKHNQYWRFDEERFNDEKAWAEPDFKISSCHICTGYDVQALRDAIKDSDKNKAEQFLELIETHMGKDLFSRYLSLVKEERPTNLYKEWSID